MCIIKSTSVESLCLFENLVLRDSQRVVQRGSRSTTDCKVSGINRKKEGKDSGNEWVIG
jgi:hypothetical protein